MGYWYPQTYTSPSNATLSIAIYGWGTQRTIEWAQNKDVQSHLMGDKYIAFGGTGEDGKFSEEVLGGIRSAVRQGLLNDYDGIAFDIETIAPKLEGCFADCFQELQNLGFKVLVTVNHATRRSSDDHDQLVRSFFTNENIDILAPQLYSFGFERQNDFTIAASSTISWRDYSQAKAKVVACVIHDHFYTDAHSHFQDHGVTLHGYIQWKPASSRS